MTNDFRPQYVSQTYLYMQEIARADHDFDIKKERKKRDALERKREILLAKQAQEQENLLRRQVLELQEEDIVDNFTKIRSDGWGSHFAGGEDHIPYDFDIADPVTSEPGGPEMTNKPQDWSQYPDSKNKEVHNIDVYQGIPFANQQVSIEPRNLKNTIAFKCDCPDEISCVYIENFIQVGIRNEISSDLVGLYLRAGGVTQIILPVFKYVLHRVEVESSQSTDWMGQTVNELILYRRLYPGISDGIILGKQEGISLRNILSSLIDAMEEDFVANADVIELLETPSEDVVMRSDRKCKSPRHTYTALPKMVNFLKSSQTDSDVLNRNLSLIFTSLNYGKCYPCYLGSDTAFYSMDL
jgi:hypothetical protein